MAIRGPKMNESRYSTFTQILEKDPCWALNRLRVTEGVEGLGLEVLRAFALGDAIYRCKAAKVHKHTSRCEEVEAFCKALPHPCFLPHSCYCAALSELVPDTSDTAEDFRVDVDCTAAYEQLLPLCQPSHIAKRAPGISQSEAGLQDTTALSILRHFSIPERHLPLFTELSRVWKYNAFSVGDANGTMAIFLLPSLCNHSCSPACDYTINVQEDGVEFTLLALHHLGPGDALTISYIEENETHKNSRLVRRDTLAEGWLFYCQCVACGPRHEAGRPNACPSCHEDMGVWISNLHGGPYEETGEAPQCDVCGEEDLVVSGPYYFHCSCCEMDMCPKCQEKGLSPG